MEIYLRSTEIIDWQTLAVLDQVNELGKDVYGPIELESNPVHSIIGHYHEYCRLPLSI